MRVTPGGKSAPGLGARRGPGSAGDEGFDPDGLRPPGAGASGRAGPSGPGKTIGTAATPGRNSLGQSSVPEVGARSARAVTGAKPGAARRRPGSVEVNDAAVAVEGEVVGRIVVLIRGAALGPDPRTGVVVEDVVDDGIAGRIIEEDSVIAVA